MKITPFAPRRFVPNEIDLNDVAQLGPLFDLLRLKLQGVDSVAALEEWLLDQSELDAALGEQGARAYIDMTCQTDDPEREKVYLHIVEVIEPFLKPRHFELQKMLVDGPWLDQLPAKYEVFRRSLKMHVRLFREENVPRETAQAKLTQQYQKTIGAMTVRFDGKEQTLAQMSRIQEEPDRARRQVAWETVVGRRLQDCAAIEEIFDQLLVLRNEIAHAADFANPRDYMFATYERFDYTPDDCLEFHKAVEKQFVPLARALQRERKEKLGVETLRPWDLAVDPAGRTPLRPFENADELYDKALRIFEELDPRLGEYFGLLKAHELVDLANRKGKAPGGYQSTLQESRLPFIFMNAVGVHRDLETIVHEAGHAFHALASRGEPLVAYRGAPMEFCEVASMSMELLTAPHWNAFYPEADAARARREHLEGIIKFFPWMATVDAFQHWIYTHPGHTRDERAAHWLSLLDRFGGIEDYTGYEEARTFMWHRQLHIIELPFYYVEYGIAQLGALQMWQHAKKDRKQAMTHYLNGLSLGGSKPLPELFTASGINFDFTEKTIAPLVEAVQAELAAIPA